MIQFLGVFAIFGGVTLLWAWSPWVLIVAGVLMVLAPEMLRAVKR